MRRALLGLGALVLALAVAAPAGALERGAGPSPELTDGSHIVARYTLCQGASPDRVMTVTVARSKPLNPEHFTFPARTRGSRPAVVRALAHALCSLPMMPAGVQACPADWGANYRLQFSLAKSSVSGVVGASLINPISVQATGCEVVRGLGTTRWAMSSAKLFAALGTAIGLRHATRATFAGQIVVHGA